MTYGPELFIDHDGPGYARVNYYSKKQAEREYDIRNNQVKPDGTILFDTDDPVMKVRLKKENNKNYLELVNSETGVAAWRSPSLENYRAIMARDGDANGKHNTAISELIFVRKTDGVVAPAAAADGFIHFQPGRTWMNGNVPNRMNNENIR